MTQQETDTQKLSLLSEPEITVGEIGWKLFTWDRWIDYYVFSHFKFYCNYCSPIGQEHYSLPSRFETYLIRSEIFFFFTETSLLSSSLLLLGGKGKNCSLFGLAVEAIFSQAIIERLPLWNPFSNTCRTCLSLKEWWF